MPKHLKWSALAIATIVAAGTLVASPAEAKTMYGPILNTKTGKSVGNYTWIDVAGRGNGDLSIEAYKNYAIGFAASYQNGSKWTTLKSGQVPGGKAYKVKVNPPKKGVKVQVRLCAYYKKNTKPDSCISRYGVNSA